MAESNSFCKRACNARSAKVRTTDVRASSICDHDIKVHATATGILANETLVIGFLDSTLQGNSLGYILTPASHDSFKLQVTSQTECNEAALTHWQNSMTIVRQKLSLCHC